MQDYLADRPKLLTIEFERDERNGQAERSGSFDNATDAASTLSCQGDTDHPNTEDGNRTHDNS